MLTFDDGPHPIGTPAVLDVLNRHNARAAFFMLGIATCEHVNLALRVHDAGHTVGYHGWRHEPESSAEAFAGLDRTTRCLQRAASATYDGRVRDGRGRSQRVYTSAQELPPPHVPTALASRPIMQRIIRYPYGYNQHWHAPPGLQPATMGIGWTLDSLDTTRLLPRLKLRRMLRILSRTRTHGHVVLMHDGGRGGKSTALLLDQLLTNATAFGWRTSLLTDFLELDMATALSFTQKPSG